MRSDARAVSPVVGVVLMIAITVTLVGGIGVAVTNVDRSYLESPPDVAFIYSHQTPESAEHELRVMHNGGDVIDPERIRIRVVGATDSTGDSLSLDGDYWVDFDGETEPVRAGDYIELTHGDFVDENQNQANSLVLDGATVWLIWERTSDHGVVVGRYSL